MHYQGNWDQAQNAYKAAIELNPIESDYLIGYGDFLWDQAYYLNQRANLTTIESLYAKASYVNPQCAQCWVKIGQAQFAHGHIELGLDNLKYALELDPYGSDVLFALKETYKTLVNEDFSRLDILTNIMKDFAYTRRGKREIDIVFKQRQRSAMEMQRYETYLDKFQSINQGSQ